MNNKKTFHEVSEIWCDAKRPIVKHSTMCLSAYVTDTPIATIWRCGKYNREGCPAVCDRQMYFRISKKNSPGYSGSAQICYQIWE